MKTITSIASERSKRLTVSSPKQLFSSMSSRALSYALVMLLAHTPRQELSSEEIDALCQLAYELLNKITKTRDILQETRHQLLDTEAAPTAR